MNKTLRLSLAARARSNRRSVAKEISALLKFALGFTPSDVEGRKMPPDRHK